MKERWQQSGQYMVDAILGIAVFSASVVFVLMILANLFKTVNFNTDYLEALYYSQEGIEAVKSIRNESVDLLTPGAYKLSSENGYWELEEGEENVGLKYTRIIRIEPIYRDSNGFLTNEDDENASVDSRSRKAIAIVRWMDEDGNLKQFENELFVLTDISGNEWKEFSSIDFLTGTFSGVELAGEGDNAFLQLSSQLELERRLGNLRFDPRFQSTFANEGTYFSSVFNSGNLNTQWRNLFWQTETPVGTEVFISLRSGNTASPDETWSDFSEEFNENKSIDLSFLEGQYIQYQLRMTSEGDSTPRFNELTVTYR